MTIENEKTKLVSNDELIKDIENTTLELSAYSKLTQGYDILSELPENALSCQDYQIKAQKHADLMYRCREFLDQLRSLADERGLIYE